MSDSQMLRGWQPIGAKKIKAEPFKVGDRVEVIEGNGWHKKGDKGKITAYNCPESICVKVSESQEWWIEGERLKLLPPEPLMICPKVGAFTKCATCSAANPHKKDNFCDKNYCGCDFCIPYEPEAKMEIPFNWGGVPHIILPTGLKEPIPMTRKRAAELGILNKKK